MATSPISRSRRTNAKRASGNGKNGTALYSLPTLYRGIYNRVAEKVGCDPSYVSRVARGERTSHEVARALVLRALIHRTRLSPRHPATLLRRYDCQRCIRFGPPALDSKISAKSIA